MYIKIQGAIMVSSLFQIVIGFTGLVGFLLRFIGPLTIAPTITLVGVALFKVAAGNAGTVEPRFTDTSLLRTIFIVPRESPYIFSKFYPLNTDTRQCGQETLVSCPINRLSFITLMLMYNS